MQDARQPTRIALMITIMALAALLVILLAKLVPLALTGGISAGTSQRVVRASVVSNVSLRDASARAQARASEWSLDAAPVRVEAAWVLEGEWAAVRTPPVAWSFIFYSPSAQSVVVVVIDDELTLWVPPAEIPAAPTLLRELPPVHGVESAWLSFRAAGGDAFLASHPQSQITFRLQQRADNLLWTVSAFDEGEYIDTKIDAQSGVVATTAN